MASQSFAVRDIPRDITAFLNPGESLELSIDTRLLVGGVRFTNSTGDVLTLVTDKPPAIATVYVPNGITTRGFPQGVYYIKLTASADPNAGGMVRVDLSPDPVDDSSSEFELGYQNIYEGIAQNLSNVVPNSGVASVISGYGGIARFRMTAYRMEMTVAGTGGAAAGSTQYVGFITSGFALGQAVDIFVRHGAAENYSLVTETGFLPLPEPGWVLTQDLSIAVDLSGVGTAPANSRARLRVFVYGIVEPLP